MSHGVVISTSAWHGPDDSDAFDPPFCGHVVLVEGVVTSRGRVEVVKICKIRE